jgi:orotate phosphoribosyltransferase-like protein
MSKVADLAYDIEALYIDGLSAEKIAAELNCPVTMVKDWINEIGVAETPQEDYSPYVSMNS